MIIQKKTEIFSIITVLFFIIGLILLSWLAESRRDSDVFIVSHQGMGNNVSQVLPVFDRQEDEDNYYLTYGWADFTGNSHHLSFPLSKSMLNEAEKEFGYFPADLRKHMDDSMELSEEKMIEDLREFVEELIRKSKYPEYIIIENITAKSFDLKLSVPPSLHKKVKREFDKIKVKIAKEQEKYLKRAEKEQDEERIEFFESRGIRVFDDKIGVNHGFCVMRNKDRIRPIFEIMHKNYANFSLHQFLGLLLAFIQDIRYYIPPLQERGKTILSFWVPPRVLADNFGDCDSKGVTFASFWTNFKKYPILLITVPNHFFVGLAIPSFTGEGLVVNGVRYTLCEVTGPGKMPPGMIGRYSLACLQNGQYVYEIVN
ncbi:MAG: hypothetical protein JSV17_15920 [Candidatus Aminicenantes bacterium]|nr:MAG: hypothetical protein JSV17_15920 [Candidatus Aminicenantes bacterium]